MTRTMLSRFAATLAITGALFAGLLTSTANAQMAGPLTLNAGTAASNIQVSTSADGVTAGAAVASGGFTAASDCGFYRDSRDAWYRHCGHGMLIIKVRSWWGSEVREICVWPGYTNLSQHDGTKGMGYITYAWAVRPGC